MKIQIISQNAPQAIGPYSQAIRTGNLLFISGQIPLDKDGNLVEGSIETQTNQCLNNISEILKTSGLKIDNVVKTTIFLKDISNFTEVNKIYGNFFEGTIFPARSTVEVSRLPKNVDIEIEVIAEFN